MGTREYLEITMQRLSSILYNSSQGDDVTKDRILDSIKGMLEDYKRSSGSDINIKDFRERRSDTY